MDLPYLQNHVINIDANKEKLKQRVPSLVSLCNTVIAENIGKAFSGKEVQKKLTRDSRRILIEERTGIKNKSDILDLLKQRVLRFPYKMQKESLLAKREKSAQRNRLKVSIKEEEEGEVRLLLEKETEKDGKKEVETVACLKTVADYVNISSNGLIFTYQNSGNIVACCNEYGKPLYHFSSGLPHSYLSMADDCRTIVRRPCVKSHIEYHYDISRFHDLVNTILKEDIEDIVPINKKSLQGNTHAANELFKRLNNNILGKRKRESSK